MKTSTSQHNFTVLISTIACAGVLLCGAVTHAADKNEKPAATAAAGPDAGASSDKLDVSDLEKKYWAAKDTDFSVVQNRAYTKTGRFALAATYGIILNDNYSDGNTYSFYGQYFFSERWGMDLQYTKNNTHDDNGVSNLANSQGAKPDFDRTLAYYGVGVSWVPFYAKMSLLNSKILYFDMAITPGIGVTTYEQQMDTGNATKTAPTFSLDITQHFFLTNHWAIRGDFTNRWFNEDVNQYHQTVTQVNSGQSRQLRTDFAHDTSIVFGIDYFF